MNDIKTSNIVGMGCGSGSVFIMSCSILAIDKSMIVALIAPNQVFAVLMPVIAEMIVATISVPTIMQT